MTENKIKICSKCGFPMCSSTLAFASAVGPDGSFEKITAKDMLKHQHVCKHCYDNQFECYEEECNKNVLGSEGVVYDEFLKHRESPDYVDCKYCHREEITK